MGGVQKGCERRRRARGAGGGGESTLIDPTGMTPGAVIGRPRALSPARHQDLIRQRRPQNLKAMASIIEKIQSTKGRGKRGPAEGLLAVASVFCSVVLLGNSATLRVKPAVDDASSRVLIQTPSLGSPGMRRYLNLFSAHLMITSDAATTGRRSSTEASPSMVRRFEGASSRRWYWEKAE